jgi:hypothetical protein
LEHKKKLILTESSITNSWSNYMRILIEIMTNVPVVVARVQLHTNTHTHTHTHTQFQSHRLGRMRNYIKPIKPWREQTNAGRGAHVAMDSVVCTEAVCI